MSLSKLHIKLSKIDTLNITKVATNKIFFDYNMRKYFLHVSTIDYESRVTMYKRLKVNNSGYYKVIPICNSGYVKSVYKYLKYPSSTLVYNQINKQYFIKTLMMDNLITSDYDDELEELNNKIDNINTDIKKLNDVKNHLTKTKRDIINRWLNDNKK